MWFKNEELCSRFLRSLIWMVALQSVFIYGCIFFFKIVSWHPLCGFTEWLFYLLHWKTILYLCILSLLLVAFGALNVRFCNVEKHINSTRLEKVCRALSPYCLQHVFAMVVLGGISTHCLISLFHNFEVKNSLINSCSTLTDDFEYSFVVGHGCFTGLMFSLKYFICNMYLITFTLDKELKIYFVKSQVCDLLKDSFFCVIKAVYWYYLGFIIFGSPLKVLSFVYLYNPNSENESTIYSLANPKLFFVTLGSGVMISFLWSLYLIVFNAFATEHHVFPIQVPVKEEKTRTLASALSCKECNYLKYLAILDFRLLSQFNPGRREQIFSISSPGGHPHEWNAISGICISALQNFICKLYEHSIAASSESRTILSKVPKSVMEQVKFKTVPEVPMPSFPDKLLYYLRTRPLISYFLNELPNAKLMKLFASSQTHIWMIDALGYLISAAYIEDRFGVIQQSLPEIIRLLLDIKMAEEKMPVGLVGVRTCVKDPQGHYEHIHQRMLLKTTVNNVLCRIGSTFKDDINGIYLPEEYKKYFQRCLSQKN